MNVEDRADEIAVSVMASYNLSSSKARQAIADAAQIGLEESLRRGALTTTPGLAGFIAHAEQMSRSLKPGSSSQRAWEAIVKEAQKHADHHPESLPKDTQWFAYWEGVHSAVQHWVSGTPLKCPYPTPTAHQEIPAPPFEKAELPKLRNEDGTLTPLGVEKGIGIVPVGKTTDG